ncbi:hypothetical protein MKEN_01451000 [Mycena kentingensis (nom. inval.)]|nr:hypothetical protein MKEN_01451000 [Mycena kentingensis (nom. inval.)]
MVESGRATRSSDVRERLRIVAPGALEMLAGSKRISRHFNPTTMGPTRTAKKARKDDGPVPGPSKLRQDKHKHQPKQESNATPGVSKIKASLRQTRRLLAKDHLAADVRAETERRLKALEAELVVAERGKKERTLAVRYHGVKFFERQKVIRKINQTKKQIDDGASGLEKTLKSLRVDLNYILHYPKTKKYISLYPPELRNGEAQTLVVDEGREEVRTWVRAQMKAGVLSAEPELHIDSRGGGVGWEDEDDASRPKPRRKGKQQELAVVEADDDFFDNDDS